MANRDLALGIDLGTSKVAAVALDASRQPLAAAGASHHADRPGPAGHALQDPDTILDAARRIVQSLPNEVRSRIGAVGWTGQMHGVALLDDNLGARTPLVTWQDQRCTETGFLDWIAQQTGHRLSTGFGCATLAWFGRQGGLPPEARAAATLHDLAVARACGLRRPVTDPTSAASWGLFRLGELAWDFDAIRRVGIPECLLPEVVPCGQRAGWLTTAAAEAFGLVSGLPVAAAIGDNQASLLATLAEPERELGLTLGTGGQLSAVLAGGRLPEGASSRCEYRPFPGPRHVAVAACLCGGAAWQWLARAAQNWIEALGGCRPDEQAVYAALNTLGLEAREELIVVPSFLGERDRPELCGSIGGIRLDNFQLGALSRGLARGILDNLKSMLEPSLLAGRTAVVGSGNALRRNPLLRRMTEDVFGLPLRMSDSIEEAACGAAINALTLLG